MPVKVSAFVFTGGIDLTTPYLALNSGKLIDCLNYECLPFGGLRRILGYTAYDGQVSGALAVPGEGPVRGVWVYKGTGYAVRDQAKTGGLFKATGAGWSQITMPAYLLYDGGSAEFVEGTTVTGLTSGATAVIVRASIDSGSTASSTLAGSLILTSVTGNFANNEVLQVGSVNYAVANGTQAVYQIPKGGNYRFWNYNFTGNAATQRMYGASGVGEAFEYDGTNFVPLFQTNDGNYPSLVVGHNDHLMLGFGADGILRSSGIGAPRDFRSTSGAADIGVGDEIVDLRPMVGGILGIGCANSVKLMYGTSSADWIVKRYSDHGVRTRTMKEIGGTVVMLDSRGVQRLDQTAAFGDFTSLSLSVPVNKRLLPTVQFNLSSCAIVSKNKDQYRLFFGKSGYIFSFNAGKMVGVTPISFLDNVLCAAEGEDESGAEFILFGSDDGLVFKMESGYKFNGANIQAAFQSAFNFEKQPSQRKHFRKASLFIESEGEAANLVGRAIFSLGGDPSPDFQTLQENQASGATWDFATWDNFEWANDYGSELAVQLDGTGVSMSLAVYSAGAENGTHTIQSAVLHYSPRRFLRAA